MGLFSSRANRPPPPPPPISFSFLQQKTKKKQTGKKGGGSGRKEREWAYWRGDENRPMLAAHLWTAFFNPKRTRRIFKNARIRKQPSAIIAKLPLN